MITVTVYRPNGLYTGFSAEGHADYADAGYDIFCAAVSVLTIHTANAIEALAGDEIAEEKSEDGFLTCRFAKPLSHEGTLFMDAMVNSLQAIAEGEGKPYVRCLIKEEVKC